MDSNITFIVKEYNAIAAYWGDAPHKTQKDVALHTKGLNRFCLRGT